MPRTVKAGDKKVNVGYMFKVSTLNKLNNLISTEDMHLSRQAFIEKAVLKSIEEMSKKAKINYIINLIDGNSKKEQFNCLEYKISGPDIIIIDISFNKFVYDMEFLLYLKINDKELITDNSPFVNYTIGRNL